MKKILGGLAAGLGLIALAGIATAHWEGGPGRGGFSGMGPGMMGQGGHWGGMARGAGYGCPGREATTADITPDKAKELAQQYADEYLKGFAVERVLPFTGMHHTMYAVELKNAQGDIRTVHINPFGNVIPFGGPWRQS